MRILLWHVHGSWTDAFVRGGHRYFLDAFLANWDRLPAETTR